MVVLVVDGGVWCLQVVACSDLFCLDAVGLFIVFVIVGGCCDEDAFVLQYWLVCCACSVGIVCGFGCLWCLPLLAGVCLV